MQYVEHDLGQRQRGDTVQVTLAGNAANVRLLDSSNRSAYKSSRRHRAIGGYAKRSPVRLQIPHSGHWYVMVDTGGLPGRVRSAVQVLPGALPPIRERPIHTPIISSASGDVGEQLRVEPPSRDRVWDLFVAHATEDKESFVEEFVDELNDLGVNPWYDSWALRLGDPLHRRIDEGLAKSRFGVVVLSPSFFKKFHTQRELDGLVMRESTGEQIILPIWHGVTREEIVRFSPPLADRLAARTSDSTIREIAEEVAARIRD